MTEKEKLTEVVDRYLELAHAARENEDLESEKYYLSELTKLIQHSVDNEIKEEEKFEKELERKEKKIMDIVNVCLKVSGTLFSTWVLFKQTKMMCEFEVNNSFTYSAGRNLSQTLKLPPIFKEH